MYWTLGIIARDDMIEGNLRPSYVLCKRKSTTGTGMKNVNAITPNNICIYKDRNDSDALIEFYSSFRTMINNSENIMPEGGLFWFMCNKFGELTDVNIFIKRVPETRNADIRDNKKAKYLESIGDLTYGQISRRDIYYDELETSNKKVHFVQKPKYYNGGSKDND